MFLGLQFVVSCCLFLKKILSIPSILSKKFCLGEFLSPKTHTCEGGTRGHAHQAKRRALIARTVGCSRDSRVMDKVPLLFSHAGAERKMASWTRDW